MLVKSVVSPRTYQSKKIEVFYKFILILDRFLVGKGTLWNIKRWEDHWEGIIQSSSINKKNLKGYETNLKIYLKSHGHQKIWLKFFYKIFIQRGRCYVKINIKWKWLIKWNSRKIE